MFITMVGIVYDTFSCGKTNFIKILSAIPFGNACIFFNLENGNPFKLQRTIKF